MRLKKQNNSRTIIIVIIAVVVVLALVVGGIFLFSRKDNVEEPKPDDIISIELSSTPSLTEYFVGEQFKPDGARVQVMTHDYEKSYFVDYTALSFSGFDGSKLGEQVITVTYKGFTTTFTITVKEIASAPPVLTSIRMGDGFSTTYTLDYWNTYGPKVNNTTLVLVYSDGSEVEVGMKRSYCSEIDRNVQSAGTTQFIVTYEDAGIVVSTTVTVTITN